MFNKKNASNIKDVEKESENASNFPNVSHILTVN